MGGWTVVYDDETLMGGKSVVWRGGLLIKFRASGHGHVALGGI